MIDVLSGILSGSAFGENVTGLYMPEGRSGVGHFVMAVNIEALRPIAEFQADMENVAGAPGSNDIFYPGELEALADERHRKAGVILPSDTVAELNREAESIGIAKPRVLTRASWWLALRV